MLHIIKTLLGLVSNEHEKCTQCVDIPETYDIPEQSRISKIAADNLTRSIAYQVRDALVQVETSAEIDRDYKGVFDIKCSSHLGHTVAQKLRIALHSCGYDASCSYNSDNRILTVHVKWV